MVFRGGIELKINLSLKLAVHISGRGGMNVKRLTGIALIKEGSATRGSAPDIAGFLTLA